MRAPRNFTSLSQDLGPGRVDVPLAPSGAIYPYPAEVDKLEQALCPSKLWHNALQLKKLVV